MDALTLAEATDIAGLRGLLKLLAALRRFPCALSASSGQNSPPDIGVANKLRDLWDAPGAFGIREDASCTGRMARAVRMNLEMLPVLMARATGCSPIAMSRRRAQETLVIGAEVAHRAALTLEEELLELLDPKQDNRRRELIVGYLGLYGRRRQTLQQLGNRFGITRERVRQLLAFSVIRHRRN